MKRKLLYIQLTLMICMFLVPMSTWAADPFTYTLTISNDKPEVGKDKEIKVTVTGDNLQDIYAYEVNFVYDTNQLRFKEAKSALNGFSIPAIVKDNQIQFASTKIGNAAGESGKLPLCTLTFEPIGKGQAAVELTDVKLVTSKMVSTKQNAGAQIALISETTMRLCFVISQGIGRKRRLKEQRNWALSTGMRMALSGRRDS